MKNIIPLLTFCFFLLQACEHTHSENMVNLNVEQFKAKMQDENMVVLDVRTPKETAEGKISGAIEIDVKADIFKNKIQTLDKNKSYLIYCRSGRRSTKAWEIMDKMGFESLYNLEGGYKAWSAENK